MAEEIIAMDLKNMRFYVKSGDQAYVRQMSKEEHDSIIKSNIGYKMVEVPKEPPCCNNCKLLQRSGDCYGNTRYLYCSKHKIEVDKFGICKNYFNI